MRFQRQSRYVETTPVNSPQKVAAAKRAIKRKVEAAGLFAHEVTETVDSRLTSNQQAKYNHEQERRDYTAKKWREARRRLNALPPISRAGALYYWNTGTYPGTPEYLLSLITDIQRGKRSP